MRLNEQRDALRARLDRIESRVLDFDLYMQGPKFQGPLQDYVRTHEVRAFLREIKEIQDGWDSETGTFDGL